MNYEQWEKTVPEAITKDSLWKVEAYRLALFVADLGWYDVTKLIKDKRTVGLSDQLYRSIGSVSANIGEGYSRGTGTKTGPVFTNMRSDPPEKAVIGTTRDDTF